MMGLVAVTGASGYVGRWVVRALADRGFEVLALTYPASEAPPHGAARNLTVDITDVEMLAEALVGAKALVHLACVALGPSARDPLLAFRVNALGCATTLEACRRSHISRVVLTSTSEVYGDVPPEPVPEDWPCRPLGAYGASKLAGELAAQTIARSGGIDLVVLRLFNILGPPAEGGIPRSTAPDVFARQAARGEVPVLSTGPEEARDFVHVRDVAAAVRLAIETPNLRDEVFNIGTGVATPVVDLARTALEAAGQPTGVRQTPGAVSRRPVTIRADIVRASERLGFSPSIDVRSAVRELVEWERAAAAAP